VPRRLLPLALALAGMIGAAALITALQPQPAFRAQAASGAAVYTQNCLSCHGGAGGPGVSGKTEPLEGRRFRQRNPTALEIFDVVRAGREKSLRALTDDQLWAAIAAELLANGSDLYDQRLGPRTAASAPTGPSVAPLPATFYPPGR